MRPLPLQGRAVSVIGMRAASGRAVFRLRSSRDGLGDVTPHDVALVRAPEDDPTAHSSGFRAACYVEPWPLAARSNTFTRAIVLPQDFSYLDDGDIMRLDPTSGRFRVLYRRRSRYNAFLVTERCNHYCLMCSQPPRDVDDGWIIDEITEALSLVDPGTASIGFTGGEPLLDWQRFIPLLSVTKEVLPTTSVHVLTNGRAFSAPEVASAWASVQHPDLCAGIPIYAAVDHIHDYVVQAQGAFDDTVLGILRLKDKGQRVEVRVVLHRVTIPHLTSTCEWLARNLPFVDHVALMGLENAGFAIANQALLWIDPVEYRGALTEGVDLLRTAGVPVSIYNLPLCLLDRSVWDVAVQSISDWKNDYLPECVACAARSRCPGFFSTGRPRVSRGIRMIAASEMDDTFGLGWARG